MVRRQQAADRAVRSPMGSPVHPPHQREVQRLFWLEIAKGMLPAEAAIAVATVALAWSHAGQDAAQAGVMTCCTGSPETSAARGPRLASGGIIDLMDVRVLYLEGCASCRTATERLRQALALVGSPDTPINLVQVGFDADDGDQAVLGGSPTILVDGQDLFPTSTIPIPAGAVCRLYSTPAGMAGSPTVEAMVGALTRRSES